MSELSQKTCTPCRSGAPEATVEDIEEYSRAIPEWEIIEKDGVKQLTRCFPCSNYAESLELVNGLAGLAEQEGHHPVMLFEFRQVSVNWWTHKIGGLHVNDFVMAAKSDVFYRSMKS